MIDELAELIIPRQCAGCGKAGVWLCQRCQKVLARPPERITPTVDPQIPIYAFGPYSDAHRAVVIAMKEHAHRRIRGHVGALVKAGVLRLQSRGELPHNLCLVPAPSSKSSMKKRGGDHVNDCCVASGIKTQVLVRHGPGVRDSVGLDAMARRANLSGQLQWVGGSIDARGLGKVVIVDDVVTTGATMEATANLLRFYGVDVVAGISICAA